MLITVMRNQKLTSVAIVVFILLLLPGCSGQNSEKENLDFSGKWLGTAQHTGSANPTFSLDLKHSNGMVTGTINSMDKTFENVTIMDTRIESGKLFFRAVANGGIQYKDHLFVFSAQREGEQLLQGTWTDILEGAQGSFTFNLITEEQN